MAEDKHLMALLNRSDVPVALNATWVGMTPTAAQANTEIARQQFGVPAIQETIRTGIVVGGVLVIALMGVATLAGAPLAWVLGSAITVLGGAWGVGAILKSRTARR